ncbi:hypothetical protein F7O44_25295 [Phytoactinopolyspora sp. XMNu-373]|uniref:GPP34 family phosphoprotein n=1 Tax=Phytoactinopolyspora mesophila TaxID=2650750 RepID=A0A7K3MAV7_9ACTN|nr:GPP34 family phosphoprotein [Phytoactinopolyspora mesophila]NDL60396.1 hypothetical protein [Phytoactinopolyspora mesophila]
MGAKVNDARLTLPDELLLLGWDDERGRNKSHYNLPVLLGAASIVELVIREAVTVEGQHLQATQTRLDHRALDRVLSEIRDSKRRTIKTWIQRLGQHRWLRTAVLEELVEQSIVRDESSRVLGVFPWSRHPVADDARVTALRTHVADVLTRPEPIDDVRDAAIGGLVHSTGGSLIRRLVPREHRGVARKRAKELSKGEAVNAEVAKAIRHTNDAVMIAMAAAAGATAATTVGGS